MEDEAVDRLGQTITLSQPVFLDELQVGPEDEKEDGTEEGVRYAVTDTEAPVESRQEQEQETESEENPTEPGKLPDINDEDERVSEMDETAVIHEEQKNSETKTEYPTVSVEEKVTENVESAENEDDTSKNMNRIEDEEDKSTPVTQSGRRNLKSRIKKVMLLGRSQEANLGRNSAKSEENIATADDSYNDIIRPSQIVSLDDDNDSSSTLELAKNSHVTTPSNTENGKENFDENKTPLHDQETEDSDQKRSLYSQDSLIEVKNKSEDDEDPTTVKFEKENTETTRLNDNNETDIDEKTLEDDLLKELEENYQDVAVEDQEYINENTENTSKSIISGTKLWYMYRLIVKSTLIGT